MNCFELAFIAGPPPIPTNNLLSYAASKCTRRGGDMTTLYGIKNCDSVKKARKWLESHAIDYHFHDFRQDGLDEKKLKGWVEDLGWESLVNKRSTTWKQLDSKTRESMTQSSAIKTMLENPTLIKRPVLDTGSQRHVGFSVADYTQHFEHHTL